MGRELRVESPESRVESGHSAFSPPPSAFRLPPSAFTLVELLVVITIISMLVALLVPAVIAARGRARIAQCTNNQHELALAIMQYDGQKKRLPGYVNRIATGTVAGVTNYRAVSWVPVLFEFLGRNDLWTEADGWRRGNPSTAKSDVRINGLICPDIASTETCALSYVLNVGFGVLTNTNDDLNPAYEVTANRAALFRNLVPCTDAGFTAPRPISLTNVASHSRCPMISEREFPMTSTSARLWNWAVPAVGAAGQANFQASDLSAAPQQYGFAWPGVSCVILGPLPGSPPYPPFQPPAPHRGIVIVTFCDGHVESLSDDTDCSVYQSAIR